MTLPELIIGTAMLGMIGTALASFTTAMSAGWRNSEQQFKIENASKRSGEELETTLSNMLYVAQGKSSSSTSADSSVFYWNQDGGLVAADKKAQLGEMALMEYDSAQKTIWLYKAKTTGLSNPQKTTLSSDNWGDPTLPAIVTYFKSLDSVERTPLIGGADSGIDVASASFNYFMPTGSKAITSYTLKLVSGTAESSSSGSIPMRAGRKPSNFN